MGNDMLAVNRLVERNGAARCGCNGGRELFQFRYQHAGITTVELPNCDGSFLQRRIAGSLAQSNDRHRGVRRTGLDRRQRISRRQPKIVMAVESELEIGAGAQCGHEREGRVGIEHAQRICDTKAPRAGRLGDCDQVDQVDQEVDIGTRGVFATHRNIQSLGASIGHEALHPLQRGQAAATEFAAICTSDDGIERLTIETPASIAASTSAGFIGTSR